MKIALVNQYVVPPGAGGGSRHLDLAREWAAAGDSVEILSGSFNHFAQEAPHGHRDTLSVHDGVRIHPLWTPGYRGNGLRRILDMVWFGARAALCRKSLSGVDIVIGSSPHPLAACAAAILARRLRVPFIYEVRDLWPETLIDLGSLDREGVAARSLFAIEAKLVRTAAVTVGVPPLMRSYLDSRNLHPRQYVHIPNGAVLSDEVSNERSHRVSRMIDDLGSKGRTVFVYAGSLGRANGVKAVVVAATRLESRGADLVVLGDGPERRSLEELVAKLGSTNVHFTGQLPKPVALACMSASTASIFHLLDAPVFKYGLSPNKLIDYLAAGRPLIYAGPQVENPGTRSGACVIARPGDSASIAEAMRSIISMPVEVRDALGTKARDHATREHSISTLAVRYRDVLNRSA
ncbi:glycosyltransferase family 4 protein [Occultella gossypii]|uniref:Glycosyltransferase family 4 protein n=1 Tax=Occultella gossypii TaxID=2800820 RepID=A0ABS7SHC1_9MICO|nr:glycosyltransferase family 4 protein [Occultella gossypii]MBZ2199135.1 glycosyltransferase family 4 protein [Occultella gossypii]